jgi:hypothetical protein
MKAGLDKCRSIAAGNLTDDPQGSGEVADRVTVRR